MRRFQFAAVAALALSVVTSWGQSARADDAAAPGAAPVATATTTVTTPAPKHRRGTRKPRTPKFYDQLGLSDDQMTKLTAIQTDTNTQLKAVRDDATLQPADRRAKQKTIRDAANTQVMAVLTPDQQTKLTDLQTKDAIARGVQTFQKRYTDLDLTDAQKTQLQPIAESWATQEQAIRADKTLSRKESGAKTRDLRKATDLQVDAILTADQKTKWQQMQQAKRGRRRNNAGGTGAPVTTTTTTTIITPAPPATPPTPAQ